MSICSRCSAPVRPVVAVDIDGTLSEYHRSITEFACNYWDRKVPSGDWNGRGDFESWMGLTQSQYREAKLAYRQGGYKRTAQWQPGAYDFMMALGALNVEVWITTTRPWNRLDSVDPDTRFWLDRYGVRYDHLLYDDHKYLRLAELVEPSRVVAVFEDLPEMITEACHVFIASAVMQIARPYNWPHPIATTIAFWQEGLERLNDNIKRWEDRQCQTA